MKLDIVTANLIENNGKFLLVQEAKKSVHGLWNFPAGKMEELIELEKNAIKEAKEETGYAVKINGLVGVYQELHKKINLIMFVFSSSIKGGKMKVPKDEILQAKWFTYEQIKKMENRIRNKCLLTAAE